MRILIDECTDHRVVRKLRDDGHDLAFVHDLAPGIDDAAVLRLADAQGRLLLTQDKGFAKRTMHGRGGEHGVVLLRDMPEHIEAITDHLSTQLRERSQGLRWTIVTIDRNGARARPIPRLMRPD